MKINKKFLPTLFLGLSCLLLLFATVNYMPLLLSPQIHSLFSFLDVTPPTVKIISPQKKIYFNDSIPLIFTISEPPSRMVYVLNGEEALLSGNITLCLPLGMYNLTVRIYDLAGNIGSDAVSFIVSRKPDIIPPTVRIISPEKKIYFSNIIELTFTVNEPISRAFYVLDIGEDIPLQGNITLNIPFGQHSITVYAYDLAGNRGLRTVFFTVSRTFNSTYDLIEYLKADDLNEYEWTTNFTCYNFMVEFIERAERRGYYIFEYCTLYGANLSAYKDAIASICVVKDGKIWSYEMRYEENVSHAVVKLILDNSTLIIEPQTDTVFRMEEKNGKTVFTVLYAGEITEY